MRLVEEEWFFGPRARGYICGSFGSARLGGFQALILAKARCSQQVLH